MYYYYLFFNGSYLLFTSLSSVIKVIGNLEVNYKLVEYNRVTKNSRKLQERG